MSHIVEHVFRLLTFNVYDDRHADESSEDEDGNHSKLNGDKTTFTIQMFGINEKGETASIMTPDFEPFFYLKVPNHWKKSNMERRLQPSIRQERIIHKRFDSLFWSARKQSSRILAARLGFGIFDLNVMECVLPIVEGSCFSPTG